MKIVILNNSSQDSSFCNGIGSCAIGVGIPVFVPPVQKAVVATYNPTNENSDNA